MNIKYIAVGITVLLLSGCGVKDPSFYDLKSPCVSASTSDIDPCARVSPELNDLYENSSV